MKAIKNAAWVVLFGCWQVQQFVVRHPFKAVAIVFFGGCIVGWAVA